MNFHVGGRLGCPSKHEAQAAIECALRGEPPDANFPAKEPNIIEQGIPSVLTHRIVLAKLRSAAQQSDSV